MDHETITIAANGLMHLIKSGRVNAKFDDPAIEADVRPLLCGVWDKTYGDELDAINVIARLAGEPGDYVEGAMSYFWIDGFGNELTRVRTAAGIIRKAKASAVALQDREAAHAEMQERLQGEAEEHLHDNYAAVTGRDF